MSQLHTQRGEIAKPPCNCMDWKIADWRSKIGDWHTCAHALSLLHHTTTEFVCEKSAILYNARRRLQFQTKRNRSTKRFAPWKIMNSRQLAQSTHTHTLPIGSLFNLHRMRLFSSYLNAILTLLFRVCLLRFYFCTLSSYRRSICHMIELEIKRALIKQNGNPSIRHIV